MEAPSNEELEAGDLAPQRAIRSEDLASSREDLK